MINKSQRPRTQQHRKQSAVEQGPDHGTEETDGSTLVAAMQFLTAHGFKQAEEHASDEWTDRNRGKTVASSLE